MGRTINNAVNDNLTEEIILLCQSERCGDLSNILVRFACSQIVSQWVLRALSAPLKQVRDVIGTPSTVSQPIFVHRHVQWCIVCFLDIDDCIGNPCQHGGVCRDRVNGFSCKCLKGWEGVRCQRSMPQYFRSHLLHCFSLAEYCTAGCSSVLFLLRVMETYEWMIL